MSAMKRMGGQVEWKCPEDGQGGLPEDGPLKLRLRLRAGLRARTCQPEGGVSAFGVLEKQEAWCLGPVSLSQEANVFSHP